MADRIVSLGRVYPGNRDWRRDLERGGSPKLREDRGDREPGNDEAISSKRGRVYVIVLIITQK